MHDCTHTLAKNYCKIESKICSWILTGRKWHNSTQTTQYLKLFKRNKKKKKKIAHPNLVNQKVNSLGAQAGT